MLSPIHLASRAPAAAARAGLMLVLCLAGCPGGSRQTSEPSDTAAPPTVRILVLDDQPLADAIRREWKASGRGDLSLEVASYESIADARRLPADCIIYPTALLGTLAEAKLIVPLPEETVTGETLNRGDVFPLVRLRETTWGEQVYAVPFGSPALVLLYRRDVLEKLDRSPPKTWDEYQELVTLIDESKAQAKLAETESPAWRPAAEPLAGHWAAQMLLARAAAYAVRQNDVSLLLDYETMEPRIDGPPFRRALEELVAANEQSPDAALETTPAAARSMLMAGECAVAITWPTKRIDKDLQETGDLPLACAPLPGSRDVYSHAADQWQSRDDTARVAMLGAAGRVGSVTSSARHTRAAASTLVWLASIDRGTSIAAHSNACSLCRSSQVQQGNNWVARQFGGNVGGEYAAILQEEKSRALWFFTPRIPGRERYLDALDAAVKTALIGEKTPELALSDAAEAWREITDDLGREQQRAAYARSLGIGR